MPPFPASSITWQLTDTLGDSELVGSRIANGWTPSELPTNGTSEVLNIPASPLMGASLPEKSFPRTSHKYRPIGETLNLIVNTFYSHNQCKIRPLLGATGELGEHGARVGTDACRLIIDGLFRTIEAGETDRGIPPDRLPPLFTQVIQADPDPASTHNRERCHL